MNEPVSEAGLAPQPPVAEVFGAPSVLTALVGRLEETAQVVGLLADARLLTITGAGGSGKTRLALAVAQQWASHHPEATTCWVDLSVIEPPGDPELLAEHVARAIGRGRDPEAGTSAAGMTGAGTSGAGTSGAELAWAAAALGPADLVVVDNCEHLLDPVAELIEAWLVAAPRLRVLTTSRLPLALPVERRWPLPPLRFPASDQANDIETYDSVRLFAERARAVRPDLVIDGDDVRTVAAICRRLDGNPLAIELCAARIQVLGLAQLPTALDNAGRLLAGRARSAPARHRTLWETLDWSHRLLGRAEAELFAGLGVFCGAIDLAAVEAIAGGDVLDTFSALLEHSLIRPSMNPARDRGIEPSTVVPDTDRFELADPVRQYARHRLRESGRESAIRDAHLRWFAGQASLAFAGARRAEQTVRYARLRSNLADIRAALGWARQRGLPAVELKLAADLAPFAMAVGLHREGRGWLERALDGVAQLASAGRPPANLNSSDVDPALRARALHAAGRLAFLQCDYGGASAHLRQAEGAFAALGDASGRAQCLQSLASIDRERGDCQGAIITLEQARRTWLRLPDPDAAELAGVALAFTLLLDGARVRARRLAEEGLAAAHDRRDPSAIADTLLVLGGAALADGDLPTAAAHLEDALARAERDDLAEARAYALEWLGVVAREQNRHDDAGRLLAEALRRQFELGDLWRTASVLVDIAIGEHRRGHSTTAARALGTSAALLTRIGGQLPPVDRQVKERLCVDLTQALGIEPFERQLSIGRSTAPAEAIAELERALLQSAAETQDQDQDQDQGRDEDHDQDQDQHPDEHGSRAASPVLIRPADAQSLELVALGGEDVRLGGRVLPIAAFGYAKPRELLFFLAERGPADKAQIGLALWPDASPSELRSAFHTTLHHLRKAVGSDRVRYGGGAYELAPTGLDYDVARFRHALADARAARTVPSSEAATGTELERLRYALSLYPGEFLPGGCAPWIEATRDELRLLNRRALLAAGRLAQRAGRSAEAVETYERLIRLDPLAEVAHRELMVCYVALGDRSRALRQYDLVSSVLHDELGLQPDPQTVALRDRLRRPAPVGG